MGTKMESLPIQYHLEIYESSWVNDPSIVWSSHSPFPALSTGDYFEHRGIEGWYAPPADGQRFQVMEIEHNFWKIKDSHIGHNLMVLLGIVNHDV